MKTQIKYWITNTSVALVMMLSLSSFSAQAATYAYRNDSFSYDTPSVSAKSVTWHAGTAAQTNGAAACTSYPNGDDDFTDITFANATLPINDFDFTFADTAYTGARIYSNGMVVFGNDISGQWRTYNNTTLPNNAALPTYTTGCVGGNIVNAIIPYWTDTVAGTGVNVTGASIQYELLGTAPSRRLVISWVNVQLYGQAARYNYQVILYESPAGGLNSNFKYQYTTGSSTGSAATIGVQVSSADSTLYSFNQTFIDPIIGSAILWYPANQLIGKGAEYHFDEATWNGTAGEVIDSSGSNQNAAESGATSNVSGGKVCRAGSYPSNTSNKVMDVVATPIIPADIGSVDFWFNSKVKWNSTDAMLLDATKVANKPFFLMKSSGGVLKFSVTDSAGTVLTASSTSKNFASNTWHHVGISWSLKPGANQTLLQVFIDGVMSTSLRTTSSGSIYPLGGLDIGDNSTFNITPSGGSPNSANGLIDEMNIYATEVGVSQISADMNSTHSCASVNHFHVTHNGTAVMCDTPTVTIEAHDINHGLVALSGASLTLSTSTAHGNWSNVIGGSVNSITNNGNGSGSYVFSNESAITFGLRNPVAVAESLVIGATSGTVTTTSGAAATCVASDYTFGSTCNTPLSFSLAGFIFSSTLNGAEEELPSIISANTSATHYLRAVKAGSSTQACVAAITGASSVNMAYECNNPTSCSGSDLMSVNGGTSTVIQRNDNGAALSYTPVAMTFDANGNAPMTMAFSDVGQVKLHAQKPAGGTLTASILGSSNAFVVKPSGFTLSAISQSAAPNLVNPGAANATGSKFVKAGESFSATVTAVNSIGNATPNYGKEIAPESVALTSTLAPGLGLVNNPSLSFSTGFSAFTAGVSTGTDFSWNDVGIITLTPSVKDADYLGAGNITGTASGNVGRFYAAKFLMSSPVINNRSDLAGCVSPCGTFTYIGEPLTSSFTITAKAVDGSTTLQNYTYSATAANRFSKLDPLTSPVAGSSGPFGFGLVDSQAVRTPIPVCAAVPLSPCFTPSTSLSGIFASGIASAKVPLTVHRSNTPSAPYNLLDIAIAPQDSDGAILNAYDTDAVNVIAGVSNHLKLGRTAEKYGRLWIGNVYGKTLYNMLLPFEAQYWNGSTFIKNIDDNKTSIAKANIGLGGLHPSSFSYGLANIAAGPFTVTSGRGSITLNKPATGAGGFNLALDLGNTTTINTSAAITISPASGAGLAYLRGRWSGATYDRDPLSSVSFGLNDGGNRGQVYIRERY